MFINHVFLADFSPLPIYFRTCSSCHEQENVSRPNGFAYGHQLLFVTDGKGMLYVDGETYRLKKGMAFYLAPEKPHRYINLENLTTAWITCQGSGMAEISRYIGDLKFLFCKQINVTRYAAQIEEIEREYFGKRREGLLSSMTYSIWMSFFDEQNSEDPLPVELALHYMEEHFREEITLAQLLRVSCCSRSTFSKKFKEHYGCTAIQKLNEIRLHNARTMLLMNHQEKLYSIAEKCGFDDIGYFCRMYKRRYGIPPSEERKKTESSL